MKNVIQTKPAYIEIIFADHSYTATVYRVSQLIDFCGELVREGREFKFGSIQQYGDIDIQMLVGGMNSIRKFGTYNSAVNHAA